MSEVLKTALEVPFPFNMCIILGALGIMLAMVGIVSAELSKYARHRLDADLKRDLVERGMSAEEIERILEADASGARKKA